MKVSFWFCCLCHTKPQNNYCFIQCVLYQKTDMIIQFFVWVLSFFSQNQVLQIHRTSMNLNNWYATTWDCSNNLSISLLEQRFGWNIRIEETNEKKQALTISCRWLAFDMLRLWFQRVTKKKAEGLNLASNFR